MRRIRGSKIALAILLAPAWCWAQGYTITTVAGGWNGSGTPTAAQLVSPSGVAVDPSGNLYVSDYAYSVVWKITPGGAVSVFAGVEGQSGYSGDGSPAIGSELYSPMGLAFDSSGNLYIADSMNGRVRRVDTNGIITTVAGGGLLSLTYGIGGPATQAYLASPQSVLVDASGNLYVSDTLLGRVLKVVPGGTITVYAGYPGAGTGDGGPATSAGLLGPVGLAMDSSGNLYIADSLDNRIRKVATNGIITTVAGTGSGSYSGDGGPATQAGLSKPQGVAVDAGGNIYISDTGDDRVRMVTSGGTITTIAGTGQIGSSGDGGPATAAELAGPGDLALGSLGKIYVVDTGLGSSFAVDVRVRLLSPSAPPGGSLPSIKAGGAVSASAFGQFASVAPGSWIEIYGSNLAAGSRSWTGGDFSGINAPTSLDGTSVTVGGQSAFIDYISPGQVNAQVPSNVGAGSQQLVVTTSVGPSTPYTVTVNSTEPGLFAPSSFIVGGNQYVGALFSDGVTYVLPPGAVAGITSRRAQPGDNITLYGIGFGGVVPNIPAGQVVQQENSLASSFHLFFGATEAAVSYAGLAPAAVGLYQFNATVPTVPASDTVPLTFTLGGAPGTQTLYIPVQ
jgi:uncharacterized protein (TIGR03437 family)